MIRLAQVAFALALVGLLCAWFAINGALESRWRDACEGGVPAVLLLAGAVLAGRRLFRRR
jgi:hypothetical protein